DAVHHALRNAQLQLMSSRRHPYYWAPFMLVGNPDLTISQRGTTDDTL
ncbi:MAG: CHAT domain-containing protein, partial [Caldilineaceae bacterium]|nr:CHAT domain-containing protein [Caldilineaceae bacterium]